MQKGPFKNYGFTYEYEGSSFVFHIVASSEEEAIGRAKAMAYGRFEGELKEALPESDLRAQFERAKKDRLYGRQGDAMQSDELLFEMHGPDGQVWRVYMDGRTEGFPTGTVVENRALPLLNALQGGFFAAMVPDLPTAAALLAKYTTTEKSLQPSDPLRVGDGSDGLPVWIGVDAEAGRTYRAYANGIVTGFGDGTITSRVGVGPNPGRATEVRTSGNHLMVQYGEGTDQKIELIKLSSPD